VVLLEDLDLEEWENCPADDMYEDPEEEYQRPVHEAQKVEQTLVYLLDEEALREKAFKGCGSTYMEIMSGISRFEIYAISRDHFEASSF
jgi:hypothetical protein